MEVIKFGGAVLHNLEGFESMSSILKTKEHKAVLVVISALSKTTNLLKKAAYIAEEGNETESGFIIDSIINQHIIIAGGIIKNNKKSKEILGFLLNISQKIKSLLRGVSITCELTPRTLDLILSFGELMALEIANTYLNDCNIDIECIDSTNIIITDSNFGSARPILNEIKLRIDEFILPVIKENKIIITQGFVARNISGEITTMGLESSNLTATIYASLLNAEKVTIWTNVEGFRSADPNIIKDTKLITHLNFNEAYIAAVNGLKLLYPAMLENLKDKNIKIYYRSAIKPDGDFTIIDNENNINEYSIIISKSDLFIIKILKDNSESNLFIYQLINNISQYHGIFLLLDHPESIYIFTEYNPKKFTIPNEINYKIFKDYTVISVVNPNIKRINNLLNRIKFTINLSDIYLMENDYNSKIFRIVIPTESENSIIKILHEEFFFSNTIY
jgi:aspartate kinase